MSATPADAPVPGAAAKLISCILPDDGRERHLLAWLRDQAGIIRANSVYCRGHSVLRETSTRGGKLPEPTLVRLVTIVVEPETAEALFDGIHARADIQRPGGGIIFMTPLIFATPFVLPEDVPNEPGEVQE
jgi:hypothetical protein